MVTSADFNYLSEKIFEKENERLSVSTLMRLWGYRSGVTPRKVTLDILSRFVGYADSVAFFDEVESRVDEQTEHPATDHVSWKQRWRAVAIVLSVLIFAGTLFVIFGRSNAPDTPRVITDLNELSNYRCYHIHSRGKVRGSLGVRRSRLCSTKSADDDHRCDTVSSFAILRTGGQYYLYCIDDSTFVNWAGWNTDAPLCYRDVPLRISVRDSSFVFDFHRGDNIYTLNINEGNGVIITDWGAQNDIYDDGNLLTIEEVGEFDPTYALKMLEQSKIDADRAWRYLQEGSSYSVYTLADLNGREGNVRHYLSASGRLCDTFTDSCHFTIHVSRGDTLYVNPTFRLCWHNPKKPGTHHCFTHRYVGDGYNKSPLGYLETEPYKTTMWNSQIFLMNAAGRFAIRSSAGIIDWWGAGLYWGLVDTDADGKPEVDYVPYRSYVWHIEPAKTH